MVCHMKTTVDVADALLIEAKRVAAREGTTLRCVLEEALRRELDRRASAAAQQAMPWLDPPLRPRVEFPLSEETFHRAAYGDRG